MADKTSVVEYYLVTDDGYLKVEWAGREPAFIMLAPLHEALMELGVFATDAEAAWPGETGEAYFYVPAASAAELHDVFKTTAWDDFVTPGRIRDTIGVSDEHAVEMVDLTIAESARLTELLHAATEHGAGLLCVVF